MVLMTGRQEVRLFGRSAPVRRAVTQLTGLNHLLAPGDDLLPTLPGSAARMPCIPGRR
jgi:hypothetical protein